MLIMMSQFRLITEAGVSPVTAQEAIGAWLAARPLECARVLSTEISGQAATGVVAALKKIQASKGR